MTPVSISQRLENLRSEQTRILNKIELTEHSECGQNTVARLGLRNMREKLSVIEETMTKLENNEDDN